jgi:hypothetical protein
MCARHRATKPIIRGNACSPSNRSGVQTRPRYPVRFPNEFLRLAHHSPAPSSARKAQAPFARHSTNAHSRAGSSLPAPAPQGFLTALKTNDSARTLRGADSTRDNRNTESFKHCAPECFPEPGVGALLNPLHECVDPIAVESFGGEVRRTNPRYHSLLKYGRPAVRALVVGCSLCSSESLAELDGARFGG